MLLSKYNNILKNMESASKEEQDRRIAQAFKDIEETKRKTQETLAKLDETMKNMTESQQALNETRRRLDQFQESYSKTMEKMAQKLASSLTLKVVYKKQQGEVYQSLTKPLTDKQAVEAFRKAKKIVIMTGAGVSAASGIRTFRDAGGYWNPADKTQKDPKQILTKYFYDNNPEECWDWHKQFRETMRKAKPNDGHIALQKIINLLRKGKKQVTFITQNIDNLHVQTIKIVDKALEFSAFGRAKGVYEIHGNVMYARCQTCQQLKDSPVNTGKFSCPDCKGPLRPHTMFFDESYGELWQSSATLLQKVKESDLGVFIGTSIQTGFVNNMAVSLVSEKKMTLELGLEAVIQVGIGGHILQSSEKSLPRILKLLESAK